MFTHTTTSIVDSESPVVTTSTDNSDGWCSPGTAAGCIPRSQCTVSPSVVLIGILDKVQSSIINIASGFIADASRGLIITSSHIFNTQPSINHPFVIAFNSGGDEAMISYRYLARVFSKHMTTCCLGITHALDSTIDIHRSHILYNHHDHSWWSSTPPLSSSTIQALNLAQPVTQMHLHRLFELCISEMLDVGQRVYIIGYDSQCNGPYCMAYGRSCWSPLPLDPMGKALAPYQITIQYSKKNLMHLRSEELLGAPCICAEGRVIGIVNRSGQDKQGGFHRVVTSTSVIESTLELARKRYDAASAMCLEGCGCENLWKVVRW